MTMVKEDMLYTSQISPTTHDQSFRNPQNWDEKQDQPYPSLCPLYLEEEEMQPTTSVS